MSTAQVREWLSAHTPLESTLLEGAGFDALVSERAAAAGTDLGAYVRLLDRSPEEVERLVAGIAVPETWMFRYPRSFELLLTILRRRLVEGAGEVRMLSVGCATGAEPFSMAITALHAGWDPSRVVVRAIDRNPEWLRIAAAARLGPPSIRGEIPGWAAPYLQPEGDGLRVDERVMRMIRFDRADITSTTPSDAFDVVFCRNVLIYLNAGARQRVLRSLCEALVIGGVLFVGHAEQFLRSEPMLRVIAAPHAFALERVASRGVPAASDTPAPVARRNVVTPSIGVVSPRAASAPHPRAAPGEQRQGTLEDARELADQGRMRESETLVRHLMQKHGRTGAALELLGLIRMASNDVHDARRCFEQAVYLEPDRTASLLQLAMISERAGDARRATALWNRARQSGRTVGEERAS